MLRNIRLPDLVLITASLMLIALGVCARLVDLGAGSLAEDEYYFAKSISFILDHGVPEFPTGGYYTRGLLIQYLTAALAAMVGLSEAVLRLIPAIFGIVTIALTYVYARLHGSWVVALGAATLLAVSAWEVEFSRFARMYSAIQTLTLVFLIVFHRVWKLDRHSSYLPHVCVVVAAMVHEASVFLAPLLFLPLAASLILRESEAAPSGALRIAKRRLSSWRERLGYAGASTAATLFCVVFNLFDFRNYGVRNAVPPDVGPLAPSPLLRLGEFPFVSIADDPLLTMLGVLALLVLAGAVLEMLRRAGRDIRATHVLLAFMLVFALTHQFLLAGVCAAVALARFDLYRPSQHSTGTVALVAATIFVGICWLGAAFTIEGWVDQVDPGDFPRAFRRVFLGFPDVFFAVVVPWRDAAPVIGVLGAVSVGVCLFGLRKAPIEEIVLSPAAFVVYLVLCVSIVYAPQIQTRYSFVMYPMLLVCIPVAADQVARWGMGESRRITMQWVPATVALVLFLSSDDFHPRALTHVASPEVVYRQNEFSRYATHWYPRSDLRSVGEFLETSVPSDGTIVLAGQDALLYYFNGPVAFYRPLGPAFWDKCRDEGRVDLWSEARVLSSEEQLRAYIAPEERFWVVRPRRLGGALARATSLADRPLRETSVFESSDGSVLVLEVGAGEVPGEDSPIPDSLDGL